MSIISLFLVTLSLVIKMNKKNWIILLIISVFLIGGGIFLYVKNTTSYNNENNYEANKTSAHKNINETEENTTSSITKKEITKGITNETPTPSAVPTNEEQIASFTTKIYTKDSARQNNINITCNTLNGTIVKKGTTFSFCNTVGQASSKKGYQKADIFDKYGNKKKGLGGGNCQISSTLYNAILSVPSLVVTERHNHSNKVPYIAKGKDAAVAYGSYDFKFKNDYQYDIKILASCDNSNVTTSIIAIKQ